MRSILAQYALTALLILLPTSGALALDRVVNTTGGFSAALAAAQPRDFISLQPGNYSGGHFRAGLTDVTIRRQPGTTGEATLFGGGNAIQLSDATDVTIEGLTFAGQTGNGLNIDDGGSFATPSTNITLRDITVRDMAAGGNNDGIKLSGVTGFLIDRVRVFNWGAGGSAVDPVGSHHGVIQNSHFRHTSNSGGSGIRLKGGSKDIVIRGNLIEMTGNGRAIQAGGSTGTPFFRFIDGDSGYEADEITAYGNRIIGASSAFSWVNIDGGHFHHNDIRQPEDWAMRILNENRGTPIVDTRNGIFTDNYVEYGTATWNRALNVGTETDANTFSFARNKWYNVNNPTTGGSTPFSLPTTEVDGEYGVPSPFVADEPMRWDFSWGEWIVPVDAGGAVLPVADIENLLIATPGDGATFSPLDADPLTGNWTFAPIVVGSVTASEFDPIFLINASDCALCQTLPGDYDRNGMVNTIDLALWQIQFGTVGAALADGNGNGVVDAADYTVWRDALASSSSPVPEPATFGLLMVAMLGIAAKR